jgi:FkbM family methyltransferase
MRDARFPRAVVVPITRRLKRGAYRIGEALGDRVLVGRTPGGSPMALSMRDHQHRSIYFYGDYEPEITELFQRLVTPGSTVYDVGANAGYFALLSGELGASVHAFEPNPAVRALLSRSVELGRGDITVVPCAVSGHAGKLPLYVSGPGNTGRSGLMVERGTAVEVDVVTLDDYSERTGTRPQLVKIDVEGAEVGVLEGMGRLLADVKPTLIVELHVTHGAVEHATHNEVAELLARAGYEYEPIGSAETPQQIARAHILARPREVVGASHGLPSSS